MDEKQRVMASYHGWPKCVYLPWEAFVVFACKLNYVCNQTLQNSYPYSFLF